MRRLVDILIGCVIGLVLGLTPWFFHLGEVVGQKQSAPPIKNSVERDPRVPVTTNIATAQPEPDYVEYVVRKGDTLSQITEKFYKNWVLYPEVARANGIKNPHLIYPNQKLRLMKALKV